MNELALFAGAGGGLLASRLLGWRTVGAVELDGYCREILLRRQADGMLDLFPVWDDIRSFDGRPWRGKVDCVTAGFPCQDDDDKLFAVEVKHDGFGPTPEQLNVMSCLVRCGLPCYVWTPRTGFSRYERVMATDDPDGDGDE